MGHCFRFCTLLTVHPSSSSFAAPAAQYLDAGPAHTAEMRSSRLSRLARLAQARAQGGTTSNGTGAIKLFDVSGASVASRMAGYAALAAAGAWAPR